MRSDSPELGKGLFGYRKSAVNQIIADRDIMLRQAEGRVRAAESKVMELEAELTALRERNSRMDEQLERLRVQLDRPTGPVPARPLITPIREAEPPTPSLPAEETGQEHPDSKWLTEVFERPEHDRGEDELIIQGASDEQAASSGKGADSGGEDDEASPPYESEPLYPEPAEPSERPSTPPESEDLATLFLREELGAMLKAAEESASRIVDRARATSEHQIAESNRLWREVEHEAARFNGWRDEIEPLIRIVQSGVKGVRSEIEEVPERIRQALAPMADAIASVDSGLAQLSEAASPPLLLGPNGVENSEGSWESPVLGEDAGA